MGFKTASGMDINISPSALDKAKILLALDGNGKSPNSKHKSAFPIQVKVENLRQLERSLSEELSERSVVCESQELNDEDDLMVSLKEHAEDETMMIRCDYDDPFDDSMEIDEEFVIRSIGNKYDYVRHPCSGCYHTIKLQSY